MPGAGVRAPAESTRHSNRAANRRDTALQPPRALFEQQPDSWLVPPGPARVRNRLHRVSRRYRDGETTGASAARYAGRDRPRAGHDASDALNCGDWCVPGPRLSRARAGQQDRCAIVGRLCGARGRLTGTGDVASRPSSRVHPPKGARNHPADTYAGVVSRGASFAPSSKRRVLIMKPPPGSYLCISGRISLLSIAESGLQVLMPQPLANGWQTHSAVDQLSGVRMPELVERASYSSLGAVMVPAFLHRLVAQRPSSPVLFCTEQ